MAVRVIDPKDMKHVMNDDRFKVKMYSHLCVPSFTNAYSMGVEYARDWFLSKMPLNFFKVGELTDNIHINEANVFDGFRRLSKAERLKRKKPFLVITPQVNFDFDLDTVHQYNCGPELLTRTGWQQDSFFRDGQKGLYLLMNMQLVEMSVTYKVSVYTRAQQLDLFKKMELWFRIGATESQDRDMDFHIPEEVICSLAADAGFDVDTENLLVKDPVGFTRYMNQHSAFPIMYKFRKVTHRFEFFLRVPMLTVHTNIMDKLRPDDGEIQGQLRTNYSIEMGATFRYVVPQFYAYYTKDMPKYEVPTSEPLKPESRLLDIGTFKIVDIPLVNERGWEKFVWSKYDYDEDDNGVIDLERIIGSKADHSAVDRYISTRRAAGISPSIYLDIKVFTSDPILDNVLRTHVDWEKMQICVDQDIYPQLLYLAIYTNLGYYNASLVDEDDMGNNRMVRHIEEEQKVDMDKALH